MWIRSQDKDVLIDVNYINIFDIMGAPQIRANHGVYLGKYSTKEKALKVLQLISNFINEQEYHKVLGYSQDYYVYEMPLDDEV